MRIPEENCNLVLLTVVTAFTAVIAGGASLLEPAPVRAANTVQAVPVQVADREPARIVGAPFVPNTNPRER